MACALAFLASACDNKPLDWNTLASSRIRDQVPEAQVKVIDDKTLEASVAGKTLRIDTADLTLQCNRGTKDCDRAFEQVVLQLKALQGK